MKEERNRFYVLLVKRMMAVILIPLLCYIFVCNMSYALAVGPETVIYDLQKKEVVLRLGFYEWLKYQWAKPKYEAQKNERKYFFASQHLEFFGIIGGVVYKARLHLPLENQALRQYGSYSLNYLEDEDAEGDIRKSVEECVTSILRMPVKVEWYPEVTVRAWSISNMDFHCPLVASGYKWEGNLELGQCFVNPVKDPWQKENCLNLVRTRQ
jgi:hypothetical protein